VVIRTNPAGASTPRSTRSTGKEPRTMNRRSSVVRHALVLSMLACQASLGVGAALAQDLGHKAPAQAGPIAIVGATIHPVSGPPIPDGLVLFEGGKITTIATAEQRAAIRLSSSVRMIDAAGKHVYPGLISPATQMGLTEIGAVRASRDMNEVGFQGISPEVRPAVSVNPDSWLIPVTRSNGVLTCGVFPTGGPIAGRVSVIRMDGWTSEEMTVDDDVGLSIDWPWMRTVNARWMDQGEDEQRRGMNRQLQTIEGAFDAASAYFAARASDPATPADLRWDAMAGVLGEGGKPRDRVYINASDYDQILAGVAFAKRRGLLPVIVGGRDAPMCAQTLKDAGAAVIVQGTFSMPRRDDSAIDEAYTIAKKLEEAGVLWCISSSEETPHERNLPYSAALAVAHGLDHDAAVRGITLSAAKVLGVDASLGSIETGKSATLIITDGSPLEITTKIEHAFIDGREIDLSNKQTEFDKKYRERYRQMNEKK
jgi:hypothetical protein